MSKFRVYSLVIIFTALDTVFWLQATLPLAMILIEFIIVPVVLILLMVMFRKPRRLPEGIDE